MKASTSGGSNRHTAPFPPPDALRQHREPQRATQGVGGGSGDSDADGGDHTPELASLQDQGRVQSEVDARIAKLQRTLALSAPTTAQQKAMALGARERFGVRRHEYVVRCGGRE